MQKRFTKDQVDYLVSEEKFIKDIPPRQRDGDLMIIKAPVYRKGELNLPIKSLEILVRAPVSVPGIPAALPSVSLVWHGHRVRGIDRETRHDNPDGSRVLGWHEHLWLPEYDKADAWVRGAQEPMHKDMRGLFKEGLRKWNIKVIKEQLEVVE